MGSRTTEWSLSALENARRIDARQEARRRFLYWCLAAALMVALIYVARSRQVAGWEAASHGFFVLSLSPWGAFGLVLLPVAALITRADLDTLARTILLGSALLLLLLCASITLTPYYAIVQDQLRIHSGVPFRSDIVVPVGQLKVVRSACTSVGKEDVDKPRLTHELTLIVAHPDLPRGRINLASDVSEARVQRWLYALGDLASPPPDKEKRRARPGVHLRCLLAMRGGLDPAEVGRFNRLMGLPSD